MKFVAYYRVSTRRQGESGLGLDAQRQAVNSHAKASSGAIVAEFTEIESGKVSERPQLLLALAQAKATDATLIVAKLDRLSRNVAFLSSLLESGVPFICCDNPFANKLTLHILAAVAEAEAEAISIRTKAALAQAKKRGVKLGASNPNCQNLTTEHRARGASKGGEVTRKACQQFKAVILPVIQGIQGSPEDIAAELNKRGYVTQRRQPWNRRAVKKIMGRN